MSKYDKTFDEKEFALYNYNATYRRVEDLFSKYRMFKETIKVFYGRVSSNSRYFEEKVCESNHRFDQTSRNEEEIINLKKFIDYCDLIINAHIDELNYYEKLIFDEVLINGKRLIDVENNPSCDRSYIYLSKKMLMIL